MLVAVTAGAQLIVMGPKISVVVLTYNQPATLLMVLQALANQCDSSHEVVIADDGSSDTNVEMVKAQLPKFRCAVKHVWHPDRGFTASQARNLGGLHSQGDYLVFLDGDCIPNKRFLQAHAALARKQAFVNGNRILLSQSMTHNVLENNVDVNSFKAPKWLQLRLQGDINKLTHLFYLPGLPGRTNDHFKWKKIRSCNFSLWRSDFFDVNGFDESFEGWGHEDADLVLRLHHSGLQRVNGFACSEVFHLWHPNNSRDQEGVNHQRVVQRMKTDIVRAKVGLNETAQTESVLVSQWN